MVHSVRVEMGLTTWFWVWPTGFETLALRTSLHKLIWCANMSEHHCPDYRTKPLKIIKDIHHPNQKLFQRLPSGKQLCSIKARMEMQRKSFSPQATSFTNSWMPNRSLSYSHCTLHLLDSVFTIDSWSIHFIISYSIKVISALCFNTSSLVCSFVYIIFCHFWKDICFVTISCVFCNLWTDSGFLLLLEI